MNSIQMIYSKCNEVNNVQMFKENARVQLMNLDSSLQML